MFLANRNKTKTLYTRSWGDAEVPENKKAKYVSDLIQLREEGH